MISKKVTALFLCFALLNLGVPAYAAPAPAPTLANVSAPSAEFTLLTQVVMLQAQALSQQEQETRLTGILAQYTATAQTDGQAERLQQAMVDLRMVSPAQAAAFAATARAVATSGTDMKTMLGELMSMPAAGAQFSWCTLGGGLLAGVSGLVLLVGYALQGFAESAGDTPGTYRAEYIGFGGLAAAASLIVLGAFGEC